MISLEYCPRLGGIQFQVALYIIHRLIVLQKVGEYDRVILREFVLHIEFASTLPRGFAIWSAPQLG